MLPKALVDRFVVHLADVLDEITRLQVALAAGGDGREPLRAAAHRLAGTAAGYGFPDVGDRARDVETIVKAGAPWSPDLAQATRALVDALAETAGAERP